MQDLLMVLVTWLSVTFGLPADHEHPRVELVAPAAMLEVQTKRALERPGAEESEADSPDVSAIYDDLSETIYLPHGWSGIKPAEQSLLVHELVHHLQKVAGLRYDCPAAREKLAYVAQSQWLKLFGRTLEGEFGLDPMTILVRTNCMR